MTVLTAVATFALAAAVIVVLPGPDTLMVLRALVVGGRRAAVRSALGTAAGNAFWALGASLGLSALLKASHDGYLALRIAGGTYLVVLGVRAIAAHRRGRRPVDPEEPLPAGPAGGPAPSGRGAGLLGVGFRAGLLTDLLNPKVGVFFVTFLPGFVPKGADVGAVSLLLGMIFVAETMLYLGAVIALSERITRLLATPRVRRRLDRATGVVLIGFGMRLALEG